MKEICILHLSDLHIKSKKLTSTLKNLLIDIEKQTCNQANIIIVVTGDIVDKGDYAKSHIGAVEFFKELSTIIKDRFKGICIVPGNHDKVRSNTNTLISKALQSNIVADVDKDYWNDDLIKNYESYFNLINDIRTKFKLRKKKLKSTYGVEHFILDTQTNKVALCFIKVDTSWVTCGEDKELHKLRIGDYQFQELKNEYNKVITTLQGEGFTSGQIITFTIAHHPLIFLKPDEENKMKQALIDNEVFNTDFYLCGHTHERTIDNWFNHERSVTTLSTGIGWDHNNELHESGSNKELHRYSLYCLSIEKNTCDIIMRATQVNGKFYYDYSVYTRDIDKDANKISYPLRFRGEYPKIKLNNFADDISKFFFINNESFRMMETIMQEVTGFRLHCSQVCEDYKHDFLNRIAKDLYYASENIDPFASMDEMSKEISILLNEKNALELHFFQQTQGDDAEENVFTYMNNNSDLIYDNFTNYLKDIATYFVMCFKDCFPSDSILRCHFRLYQADNDKYRSICHYANTDIDTTLDKLELSPREIEYGGMIEQAHIHKCSMICSSNEKLNSLSPKKWDDFITIVPDFLKYERHTRRNSIKITRPIITFGASVINKNISKKNVSIPLYFLEYLGFQTILTDCIDDYVKIFPIDYSLYSNFFNNKLKNAEE